MPGIDHVDFSLPPDHPYTAGVLGGKAAPNPDIRIGCPVWADKGFTGRIYPEDAREKDFLRYYAAQFNCIELNVTHYKIPVPAMIRRWLEMTGDGFLFCPKVPQVISHARNLNEMQGLMKEFIAAIHSFGSRLGTSFMQLPPHFGTDRLKELLVFLDAIPQPVKLSLELRHESWFGNRKAADALYSALMEFNYGLVITDVAGRRDVLHQCLTNKTAMIRSVSNNLHPTDFSRLNDWAARCAHWLANGLEELYFFIHTPDKGLCPELANHFITQLNRQAGLQIPLVTIRQKNVQGDLFS